MPTAKHILIVEDDYAIADVLTQLLEMEGYSVAHAASAQQALDIFAVHAIEMGRPANDHASHPDLILLDLQLSNMDSATTVDGDDLIHTLKQHVAPMPPVIVVSAKREAAVQAAAESIGAAAFMYKPFDVPTLLHYIYTLVGNGG